MSSLKLRFAPLIAASVMATISSAFGYEDVKGLDLLVDSRAYAGKNIRIVGCDLSHASIDSVLCNIRNDRKKDVGVISIDGRTLDRATMRRLLQECEDWFDRPKRCRNATIEGTLEFHPLLVDPRVVNAKITFQP